jgi:hypothetical protein
VAVLGPPTAAFALVKVAPAPSPTVATAVPPAELLLVRRREPDWRRVDMVGWNRAV